MPATFLAHTRMLALLLVAWSLVGCASNAPSDATSSSPAFLRCEQESECPPGYGCTWGVCMSGDDRSVATDAACLGPADCGAGMECKGGACVATMRQCDLDVECGFGDVCRRGRCTNAQGKRCQADHECPGGRCVQRRCQ